MGAVDYPVLKQLTPLAVTVKRNTYTPGTVNPVAIPDTVDIRTCTCWLTIHRPGAGLSEIIGEGALPAAGRAVQYHIATGIGQIDNGYRQGIQIKTAIGRFPCGS